MPLPHLDLLRPVDQSVLELIRRQQGLTVQQLTSQLQVTATAVRQRLERLLECDMVERTKVSAGRGRPQYRYGLTPLGTRYTAAGYADLATALWREVMDLPNPQQRGRILRRVAKRMGETLKRSIPQSGDLSQRFVATAKAFGRNRVPAQVNDQGELPVLEVYACPYPELADSDDSRQLCEMEQEILSEAMGESIQLDCCRLDGHSHCEFRPAAVTEN